MSQDANHNVFIDMSEVNKKFNQMMANIPGAETEFLTQVSEAVKAKAKIDCPFDTGHLENTIGYTLDGKGGSIIHAGNESINYAATVHENLSANHPKGQAKYIERNINMIASDGADNFAQVIADKLLEKLNK